MQILKVSGVRSYRDLVAWQKAMRLVTDVYRYTESFPKAEVYGLTAQLRRAAISVPSNIAEGQGRASTGEFKQFLGQARIVITNYHAFLPREQGDAARLTKAILSKGQPGVFSETPQQIVRRVCRDLGSKNGVLVNGKKTARRFLRNGDIITLGMTEFKFESTVAAPDDEAED